MPRLDLTEIVAALGDPGRAADRAVPEDQLGAMFAEILGIDPGPARSRLLGALGDAGLLDAEAIRGASLDELTAAIRPRGEAGKKRIQVLRGFAAWLVDRGGIDALQDLSTSTIRRELSEIRGLGPATVESILLFGLGRPAYPIDRATYRVLVRHGWIDMSMPIDEVRELILDASGGDSGLLDRLSRGLDRIGRIACRPSAALCERCPLSRWLPAGGPLGSDA